MSIARARSLRKQMPPSEARLWSLLRDAPFKQFHFRRQVPLGRYYADFASHSAKLVIELDGDTHYEGNGPTRDVVRDKFIEGEGYAVMRFTNDDVLHNLDGVGQQLLTRLESTPTRRTVFATLPTRGREGSEYGASNSTTNSTKANK